MENSQRFPWYLAGKMKDGDLQHGYVESIGG